MKHFTCALPVLFAALIMGCSKDDNLLDAPAQSIPLQEKASKRAAPGQIWLDLVLHVPGEFNSFVEVKGAVEYATTIVPRDPIPPNPQFSILAEISLGAELRPYPYELVDPVWRVAASTRDDVVPTDGDGTIGHLTKRYFVSGLNKWLCLSFTLTVADVELSRSWLESPKAPVGDAN